MRDVVVTGLGAVSPCGLDVPTTWEAMLAGRSGTDRVTHFDVTGWPSNAAGEVRGFDADARLGARDARRMGRFMTFGCAAAEEAMASAGLVRGTNWPEMERFGVWIGSGIGGFPEICGGAERLPHDGVSTISPWFIPRSLIHLVAGHISIRLGAGGPSLLIATACAASNHAIGDAYRAIATGAVDVAIAGGAEASLHALGFGGFMNMRALSRRTDRPDAASRPFHRDRDGFVMAEGSGLVVLEAGEHARARGARTLATVLGYAATSDAHHVTAPAPDHAGAARCMAAALRSGGLAPGDIDYINAHGTGTPMNDPAECAAIRRVFGSAADQLCVSSTKGVTGHLLGAAGGVEAVASVCALRDGVVPPTAHLDDIDPACDLDLVPLVARPRRLRAAMSNAFGFGGTNAVVVFGAA